MTPPSNAETYQNRRNLVSILCSERWLWQSESTTYIEFKEDYTGQLLCCMELCVFTAAQFSWKPNDPNARCWAATSSDDSHLLGQFAIEITLHKEYPVEYDKHLKGWVGNAAYITEKAFLPKTHLLSLEKGRFRMQSDLQSRHMASWASWYEFKLVFEVSPFPPPEECTENYNGMGVDAWKMTEFCSHAFPVKDNEGMIASSWAWVRNIVKG